MSAWSLCATSLYQTSISPPKSSTSEGSLTYTGHSVCLLHCCISTLTQADSGHNVRLDVTHISDSALGNRALLVLTKCPFNSSPVTRSNYAKFDFAATVSIITLDYGYNDEPAWQQALGPKHQRRHQRIHHHNKEPLSCVQCEAFFNAATTSGSQQTV